MTLYLDDAAVQALVATMKAIKPTEHGFAMLRAVGHEAHLALVQAGISDCDMEKGQMRCDANISIRPVGETKLGTKVELKNLNSISYVRDGIVTEIAGLKEGDKVMIVAFGQGTNRRGAGNQSQRPVERGGLAALLGEHGLLTEVSDLASTCIKPVPHAAPQPPQGG